MTNILEKTAAPNFRWYLVQCKPNAAQTAIRNLENQSFTTFLPMQESTQRKGNVFQRQIRPLFPGYIFIQLDPGQGSWRQVNNTRGVAHLVQLSTEPSVVPSSIIKALLARCDERGIIRHASKTKVSSLQTGDEAQITRGPFSGIVATVTVLEPDDRIYVLLEIMGQTTKVAFDADALAPTS
jgi:transcriptional antiterminator RfaH